jgi:site-specific recombinase XerD
MAGIRRQLGVRQVGKSPTLTSNIAALCSHLPVGLKGIRDRALLLVGFARAFRRSELVALTVEDVQFVDESGCLRAEARTGRQGHHPGQ